jgi:hypothetical protein
MELVVLGLLIAGAVCIVVGTVGAGSALLSLLYGKLYYDHAEATGARKWTMFRYSKLWNILRLYVSFVIHDAESNTPIQGSLWKHIESFGDNSNFIFACHPHGLIPLGPLLTFGAPSQIHFPRKDKLGPPPRLHVHRLLFAIPFLRDLCLWLGFLDISESVLRTRLAAKEPIALLPAGSRGIIGGTAVEIVHCGFLRLAFEYKTSVVPCWTPKESHIFKTWDLFPAIRQWAVAATGYPFPTPFIGPLPFKRLVMYVGKPVDPRGYDTLEMFKEAYHSQLMVLIGKFPIAG